MGYIIYIFLKANDIRNNGIANGSGTVVQRFYKNNNNNINNDINDSKAEGVCDVG